jgi:hypothetical protein
VADAPSGLSLTPPRETKLKNYPRHDRQELGFDIINVKKITAKRPSPEGLIVTVSLPPFLATLSRRQKSHTHALHTFHRFTHFYLPPQDPDLPYAVLHLPGFRPQLVPM